MDAQGQDGSDAYFGQISTNFDPREQVSMSGSVFKTILFYCVLVIGGPLVGFFATKTLILGFLLNWDQNEIKTDVVSAIVAGKYTSSSLLKTKEFKQTT